MKKIICCVVLLFLALPKTVSAHAADQPPYLKIEGKYTDIYPVYGSTVDEIAIPNDIAVDTYIVNTPILFELTEENLPLPQELLAEIRFTWDFGDGTKETGGLAVSHVYTKIGSYISSLYAIPPEGMQLEPVLLQATMIHIVPDKNFKIPKAVIAVDGKRVQDSLLDVLELPLTDPVNFDASKSTSSSKIMSYEWDFGDKVYKKTREPKISYHYDLKSYEYGLPLAFAVVRVRDENGFISDTYAQINNTTTGEGAGMPSVQQGGSKLFLYGILLGVLIIAPVIFFTVKKKK